MSKNNVNKECSSTKLAVMSIICGLCALLTIGGIFSTTGCTVTQQIDFSTSTAGTSHTDLNVEHFFIEVLEDMGTFAAGTGTASIMDSAVADFENSLSASSNTKQVTFTKVNPNHYVGDFSFSDFSQLFKDLAQGQNQSVITLTQASGKTTLNLNLSMANYDQLTKMIPFLADPNFEVYGPVYNQGMKEADYLEMISYILGEEGPEAISKSLITLRFTTPSAILSQQSGTLINSNTIEFSFKLIDFMLLAAPIQFSVTW